MVNEEITALKIRILSYKDLIINADDLGKNKLVNDGIVFCLNNQLVNSTSLLVNEPSFEEAVGYIQSYGFKKVGLHVNLSEGRPLQNCVPEFLLNEDGQWDSSKLWTPMLLKKEVSSLVEREIMTQFEKMVDSVFLPTHINSHHHVHANPFLFRIFLKVAKRSKVKLRIAQSYNENNYLKYCYRMMINNILIRSNLAFSDSFETLQSWQRRRHKLNKVKTEIMVHPMYLPDYSKIVDSFDNIDLIKKLNLI
jgi:chitin disaccharide deacetylase